MTADPIDENQTTTIVNHVPCTVRLISTPFRIFSRVGSRDDRFSSPIFLLVTDVSNDCVAFSPIETLPDKLCERRWKERPKAPR
jgi:hypothetical protein